MKTVNLNEKDLLEVNGGGVNISLPPFGPGPYDPTSEGNQF